MPKNPSSNPHGLSVGDCLFYVANDNRRSTSHVSVEKIGRKWVTLSNYVRVDISTLAADGGDYMSPGTAYRTEKEYRDRLAVREAWASLNRHLGRMYSMPDGMTVEKMDQIADLLGIDRSEA